MGFFNFLLIIVLFCMLLALQGKVGRLEETIKYLCRKINDYEKMAFRTPVVPGKAQQEASVENVISPEVKPEEQTLADSVQDKTVEVHADNLHQEQTTPEVKPSEVVQSPQNEFEKVVAQSQFQPKPQVQPQVQTPKVRVSEPKVVRESFDIQKALLGNVFNKIGALAIIIAMVIFIKLISPFFVITPMMKLIFGYVLGFGFLTSAFIVRRKDNMRNFSEVLLGTGFATLFITSYCGYSFLHIFNSITVLIIGGALLTSTYMIAEKMKTVSMLVIGLLGCYVAPIAIDVSSNNLFAYFIFVNALSLIFTLRNKHYKVVNLVNLSITLIGLLIAMLFEPVKAVIYPVLLWGVYLLYDLFRDKTDVVDNVLSAMNYTILTLFSLIMFHSAHDKLSLMFSIVGGIYFLLSIIFRVLKNEVYKGFENYIFVNAWLAIVFFLHDVHSVLAWALLGFIASILVVALKAHHLKFQVIVYYATVFLAALFAHSDGQLCLLAKYTPFLNIRTIVYLIPVILMMLSASMLRPIAAKTSNWMKFTGVSLFYIYLVGEVNSWLSSSSSAISSGGYRKFILFNILGFMYALNLKKIFLVTKSWLFNIPSYIFLVISLLCLVIGSFFGPVYDLPILNLRTVCYALAVISCLLFAKWDKADVFKFFGISLCYFWLGVECNGLIHKAHLDTSSRVFARAMLDVIIAILYALNLKKLSLKENALLYSIPSYVVFILAGLVLIASSYFYPSIYTPVFNLRFVAYVIAIIACMVYANWDKSDIYKCIAVILGFFLCHSESAGVPKIFGQGWQYLISLSWVLYSGIVTIAGIVKNRKYLISTGIVIIIMSILRIFLFDLAKVDALFKLIAFLALGIILMLVSYIYTAYKNKK